MRLRLVPETLLKGTKLVQILSDKYISIPHHTLELPQLKLTRKVMMFF
jgi:hypothetical protein